jgi:hypothetical protein
MTLPLVFWNNVAYGAPTNNVTVRVDMTAKVLTGAFTNNGGIIRVSGGFTGWGDGVDLTNNPSLTGNASNHYSMVFPIVGFPGDQLFYKFRMNGGWESPASGVGNDKNRVFTLAGGDQVLPLVFYNDDSLCDLLLADTDVTFTLMITNGTPDRNGVPFVKGVDKIYINGQFVGWLDGYGNWNDGIVNPFVDPNVINAYGDLELTNNPIGSDLYQQTLKLKAGLPLSTTYKFSLNGFDNELGFGVNHLKFVRTTGTSYTMPLSYFGSNYIAELSEQSFGNLTIAPGSGGTVPINWLGRQCVTLQTKSTINGAWTDLPATDAKSSTNYPNTGGNQFFRLQKRNNY